MLHTCLCRVTLQYTTVFKVLVSDNAYIYKGTQDQVTQSNQFMPCSNLTSVYCLNYTNVVVWIGVNWLVHSFTGWCTLYILFHSSMFIVTFKDIKKYWSKNFIHPQRKHAVTVHIVCFVQSWFTRLYLGISWNNSRNHFQIIWNTLCVHS